VLFELPTPLLGTLGKVPTNEELIEGLSYWHADYLIEQGIAPVEPQYAQFQERKKEDALRAAKSPDLIVSASGDWKAGVPKDMVEVTTADDRKYFVWRKEYDNRKRPNLLSSFSAAVPA
jgi:hypothetical protein